MPSRTLPPADNNQHAAAFLVGCGAVHTLAVYRLGSLQAVVYNLAPDVFDLANFDSANESRRG
mgnify:CR=1 FL=1